MACLISASVGRGFCAKSSDALMIIPLLQYPQWGACSSMKACCNGCSAGACGSFFFSAYQAASPSRVITALPATAATGVTQERISTPSANTEQEPHCASPQPNFGPCRRNSFESTYRSGVTGLALTGHARPFTVMLGSSAMGFFPIEIEATSLGGLHRVLEPSTGRDRNKHLASRAPASGPAWETYAQTVEAYSHPPTKDSRRRAQCPRATVSPWRPICLL